MMWSYFGDGGNWWNWLWMGGMMVLFWGGVIVLGVLLIRSVSGPRAAGDDAMDTLRKRLAAGQITQDEFEQTRRILQG